eukprot:gnl/MRDRNA2_/MRDRNA2_139453_c0_seq1.p1 gnl/MRDRNA2_/MRDRNA2_139453_c0~~gnl/MRDRNA2_/MRDRNA2_139453_c0_seq1.p1  ORF type:complete len:223 (-),score=38.34 gnl/MRDRNA2_/MRDRNA2_139453_c0_seq1:83-751(-)
MIFQHTAVVHNRVKNSRANQHKHHKDSHESRTKVRAEAGQYVFKQALSPLEEDLNLEPINPYQGTKAAEANAGAPILEGMLKKRAQTLFGFGPAVWHNRYVVLDPSEETLSYWDPGIYEAACEQFKTPGIIHFEEKEYDRPSGPPKRTFRLMDIVQVESNHRHFILQVIFANAANRTKASTMLQLQASDLKQFNHWLDALRLYGMRAGPKTPKAKKNNKALS